MTVHNAGRFLAPAVRSVLAQTRSDFELLILDNASTDGAVPALAAAGLDPRIALERAEGNLGIAAGTNRLAARARGRFVAVLDHDDELAPEKLARQVAWLEAHPAAGGVAARTELIDADGREVGGDFTLPDAAEYRVFTAYSQAANFGSHLFRREWFERFPRREAFPFSSDFDFVARVAEATDIGVIPETLFRYRVHGAQTTQQRRPEQVADEVVIRILTAHRRAGLAEPEESLPDWRRRLAAAEPGLIWLRAARLCRELGLSALAAYHARRAAGAGYPLRALAAGLGTLRDPRAARLFFTGPLRTHGLHPWPPR
jgi:GT2 family glycosyltransferase